MEVNTNIVSPEYIRLMGVPFVRGRDLEPGERNAVLVNRAFAQRFWSGQNAVGRRLGRPRLGQDLELIDVRSDDTLTARTVSGRIDIERVRAPRLEVKSFSGAVALQRVESRRVEVEPVSGSVSFGGALAPAGRYEVQSHSGSILFVVPDGSGFELDAESFSGDLRSDIPILVGRGYPTGQTTVFERGNSAIRGVAAAGGARLTQSTVSGDMAISAGDIAK